MKKVHASLSKSSGIMYTSTGASFYTGQVMLVDNEGLCSNTSQSGALPYGFFFVKGGGGEKQFSPWVNRRITRNRTILCLWFLYLLTGINYSKNPIYLGKLMDEINWQQLCLFVTVSNLKDLCWAKFPVWLLATCTFWTTCCCKWPYYCWYKCTSTVILLMCRNKMV